MNATNKKNSFSKQLFYFLLVLCGISVLTFLILPEEQKNKLLNFIGIEQSDLLSTEDSGEVLVVRNTSSRKALIGNKWIISGKLFNIDDSLTVNHVKLMFNFSDGIETVEYNYKIRPKNTFGKKFKEKFSGHEKAEFLNIDVVDVKTD
ncbi:MAG: hypothetical protein WDZ35_14435 [Crocinitomicaceae bacterium]